MNAQRRARVRAMADEARLVVSSLGGLISLSDGSLWLRQSDEVCELVTPPYSVSALEYRRMLFANAALREGVRRRRAAYERGPQRG